MRSFQARSKTSVLSRLHSNQRPELTAVTHSYSVTNGSNKHINKVHHSETQTKTFHLNLKKWNVKLGLYILSWTAASVCELSISLTVRWSRRIQNWTVKEWRTWSVQVFPRTLSDCSHTVCIHELSLEVVCSLGGFSVYSSDWTLGLIRWQQTILLKAGTSAQDQVNFRKSISHKVKDGHVSLCLWSGFKVTFQWCRRQNPALFTELRSQVKTDPNR